MLTWIVGIGVALVTASGWFMAWRSRGEALDAKESANAAAERARIAEAKAGVAADHAVDAEARASTAVMQYKASEATLVTTQRELAAERAGRADLLEQLAKLGAPVGDVLLDSTIDRLYKNGHREGTGGGPSSGAGGNQTLVPGDAAGAPTKPDPRG